MRRRSLVALVAAVGLAAFLVQINSGTASTGHRMSGALRMALSPKAHFLPNGAAIPTLSGGYVTSAQEARSTDSATTAAAASYTPRISGTSLGCRKVRRKAGFPANIRANQDCSLRREAEEQIAVNPADPNNIVIGQNFSPLGFNQTGINYSIDGGQHWGTYGAPTRFLTCASTGNDAYSDPAFTFDRHGNLYYSAVGFNLASPVGDLVVWKSDAANKGSSLHNPDTPLVADPVTVVENCGVESSVEPDKQFMAADTFASSPYVDNVYVTWTNFDFSCGQNADQYCASEITFSKSTDGGSTWSTPLNISGNSSACTFGDAFDPNRSSDACDFDQGSFPVVSKDGSINVTFNNCNTDPNTVGLGEGVCQQLFTKSTDGGDTWSDPVKVGDDFATQPFNLEDPNTGGPMTDAGCDFFRQCLLPNGYRMNDYPAMGVQNSSGKLAVFWSDFRNGGPCAVDSSLGVDIPVEPCDNHNQDVFVSVSTDGGDTWGATHQVTAPASKNDAAQWQAWGDVGENGKLYVAYYDRKYGDAEALGSNDITLATSSDDGVKWSHRRITTASMPNLTPETNPIQAGFLGDYMFIQATNGSVYLTWADTRGLAPRATLMDEDVYFAKVPE